MAGEVIGLGRDHDPLSMRKSSSFSFIYLGHVSPSSQLVVTFQRLSFLGQNRLLTR